MRVSESRNKLVWILPSVSIFNRRLNIRKRRRYNSKTTKIMKALFINGSPRKNGNTAQLLKRAMDGAREAGGKGQGITN